MTLRRKESRARSVVVHRPSRAACGPAAVSVLSSRLIKCLHLLAGREVGDALRRHVHPVAGPRVASSVRLAAPESETAEAPEFDLLPPCAAPPRCCPTRSRRSVPRASSGGRRHRPPPRRPPPSSGCLPSRGPPVDSDTPRSERAAGPRAPWYDDARVQHSRGRRRAGRYRSDLFERRRPLMDDWAAISRYTTIARRTLVGAWPTRAGLPPSASSAHPGRIRGLARPAARGPRRLPDRRAPQRCVCELDLDVELPRGFGRDR